VNPPPSEGMMNHRYEERRLNEAIAMLDEKYEEKYNHLQLEIQQKGKGKISRVDSLLNRSSPFTECITTVQLLEKFKVSTIQTYTGVEDPTEHLDNYKTHMDQQGTPQELACQAFPLTLSGSARDWFRKLPPSSITSFEDLGRKFITQFLVRCKRKKPSGQLMAMRQKGDESLKDYMIRFNQAKLTVDNPTEEMVYAAFYQGLRVEGPLMSEIALNHPENLADLTDVIEKYVNQEEILSALRESQKQKIEESSNLDNKEKARKEEKRTDTKKEPAKYYQFSIDEWTPLNSPINEVLTEIKKDLQYEKPYPLHNKYVKEENRNKFYAFHNARGHITEECTNLRILIEKFIKNGKLLRFIADNQGQPRQNQESRRHQDQEPRHRDRSPQKHQENHRDKRREEPCREEPRRNRSRSNSRGTRGCGPCNEPVIADIRTIFGGFGGGGETSVDRKAYARYQKHHEVMTIERPHKSHRRESMVVGFSDEDYAGVSLPQTNAIVVTLQVANHRIHQMFINNGSLADILYWSAFQHMEISPKKVISATCPLVGFAREQVQLVGSIELPLTARDYPVIKTIMVKFLLIDRPSAYNAILGRTALNDLKAITSTSHLKIKFLIERGVGEVRGE
jgi:hypothetical protein